MKFLASVVGLVAAAASVVAQGVIDGNSSSFPVDLNGSNFTYPYPVKLFKFTSQRQPLEMAFMDVAPTCAPNGKTAMLFHGKNFCGPTWQTTIKVLTGAGWRVIAPDMVGFCKSSKPERYQYSLQQFALNANNLLKTLGIKGATIIGHSVGGMLAARYSLMYPNETMNLVVVNSVGLEDYTALGVPYLSIDDNFVTEAASNYTNIRGYEQATYYVGDWKPEYDVWVNMLVNIYKGSKAAIYPLIQAQIVDLVLTQPVSYSFGLIKPRTLVMIGAKDNTAIGKPWSPPDVAAKLGHFDVLGPMVAKTIPNATLHLFPNAGHAPQLSNSDEFHDVLLKWLALSK